MSLTARQRTGIAESLRTKIRPNCPMCTRTAWTLGDEFVAASATSLQGGIAIGGPFIPMIQMVCNHCGFVSHHAVGAVGVDLSE